MVFEMSVGLCIMSIMSVMIFFLGGGDCMTVTM